ncbi:MAG: ABC transporter permease [Anaerolineae bacterium]|nr:ABC transporter permease [Anaerolineae bacterium]
MSPLIRFILIRLILFPVTFIIVTATLYAMLMLTPPQVRAMMYLPARQYQAASSLTLDELYDLTKPYIKSKHLEDPYPIQYGYWLVSLVTEGGGYSPTLNGNVFEILLRRTPATAELTLYSLLLFVPLGMVFGARAGWKINGSFDLGFRFPAFIATSLPPFILALVLLSVFYAGTGWFPPGRLSLSNSMFVSSGEFRTVTGLLTIDGLLNGRLDITVDAFRHLVLPVITLSLVHWATLGRITRNLVGDITHKQYLIAGRARGIPEKTLLWRHSFRNVLAPSLSSTALSIASLYTGVFMIESIFDLKGVAGLIVGAMNGGVDTPLAMGFSIYSILVILIVMFVLDILRVLSDPLTREGISST